MYYVYNLEEVSIERSIDSDVKFSNESEIVCSEIL